MYTGSNPKALLTVTLLADAFEEEMQEQAYEKISIRALCARAEVSRQAFYNVYDSKEEVLRFCIDRVFGEVMERRREHATPQPGSVSAHESIRLFVDIFYENRAFMDRIVANHLEKELTEEFVFAITDLTSQEGWQEGPHTDYQLAFYAGGIVQILIHWMRDEERLTTDELIEILEGLDMPYFT